MSNSTTTLLNPVPTGPAAGVSTCRTTSPCPNARHLTSSGKHSREGGPRKPAERKGEESLLLTPPSHHLLLSRRPRILRWRLGPSPSQPEGLIIRRDPSPTLSPWEKTFGPPQIPFLDPRISVRPSFPSGGNYFDNPLEPVQGELERLVVLLQYEVCPITFVVDTLTLTNTFNT